MTSAEIVYLLARLLTCGIWIAVGFYKATHVEHTVKEMAENDIPLPHIVLPFVIILELFGAALLIADLYVWAVVLAWLVFLVPASYLYHFRYMVKQGTINFGQWVTFWKNVSIAGGLLAVLLLDTSRPAWLFT
jgi:uncharacterized membrane protein YphA (DoxX/SURF4 family)